MKKLSCYLLILITFLLIGINNVDATEIKSMTELNQVLKDATVSGTTIKLTKDVSLDSDTIILKEGTYILDLNGFKISSIEGPIKVDGASLTIDDSSSNKTGLVEATTTTDTKGYSVMLSSGNLTINGGNFGNTTQDKGLDIYGGTAVINGGNITGKNYGVWTNFWQDIPVNVTITNGNINSKNGICITYQNTNADYKNYSVKISGGNVKGTESGLYAVEKAIPFVKISGGTFEGTKYGGLMILQKTDNIDEKQSLDTIIEEGYGIVKTDIGFKIDNNNYYIFSGKSTKVSKSYKIIISDKITNGKIVTIFPTAIEGETVYLIATEDEGYELSSVTATDQTGEKQIKVKDESFIMPNHDVYVNATFIKASGFAKESTNQTFIIDKTDYLDFKVFASAENIVSVYIDDNLINNDNYTITNENNATIRISNDSLKDLKVGSHTIKVALKDGSFIETTFNVKTIDDGKTISAPNTGSITPVIQIFAGIALVSIGGYLLYRKYKNPETKK